MKKVKFIGDVQKYKTFNLTYGKVYDVIKYNRNVDNDFIDKYDEIYIINNEGEDISHTFPVSDTYLNIFQDVTSEYRNDIIDEILN